MPAEFESCKVYCLLGMGVSGTESPLSACPFDTGTCFVATDCNLRKESNLQLDLTY